MFLRRLDHLQTPMLLPSTYPEQRRRYVIGKLTYNLTDDGFKIEGLSAFLLFALIAVYFVVGRKYLGSTIWQRVLRA
jgi:hypothetical protein